MYDVDITMDETTTSHRITVSDFFLELVNVEAPEMLKRTFVYLYGNKAVRSTERNVRLHSLLSSSLSSCPSQFTTMHIRARYTQTCHSSSVYIYIYMCMSRCARSLTDHNDNVFPPMCIVHTPSHLSAMSLLCAHTHTHSLSLCRTQSCDCAVTKRHQGLPHQLLLDESGGSAVSRLRRDVPRRPRAETRRTLGLQAQHCLRIRPQ